MFEIGHAVPATSQRPAGTVVGLLGEGGQGIVLEVELDTGERVALKWYKPGSATAHQRDAIIELIRRGSPDDRFLWPVELVELPATAGFGYIMAIRPERFRGVGKILRRDVTLSRRATATLCFQLADAFLSLHMQGLCYRDISFGNIFVEPTSGNVLICDNDNVTVDGATYTPVLGTPYFMAPEVMRREARPSSRTDLFSLSVLIFYLLVGSHPLMGSAASKHQFLDDALADMLGRSPVFVLDVSDSTNRPIEEEAQWLQAQWEQLPEFVRHLFITAFTIGIHRPEQRIVESMWCSAAARLRDSLARCPECSDEHYVVEGDAKFRCLRCRVSSRAPMRLRIGRRLVVLNADTKIFRHHLYQDFDFSTVVASVVRHPDRPDVWGLRNDGTSTWQAVLRGHSPSEVAPQGSIRLVAGTIVDINGWQLEIMA